MYEITRRMTTWIWI